MTVPLFKSVCLCSHCNKVRYRNIFFIVLIMLFCLIIDFFCSRGIMSVSVAYLLFHYCCKTSLFSAVR
jgi:hypothetical protein